MPVVPLINLNNRSRRYRYMLLTDMAVVRRQLASSRGGVLGGQPAPCYTARPPNGPCTVPSWSVPQCCVSFSMQVPDDTTAGWDCALSVGWLSERRRICLMRAETGCWDGYTKTQ
jgi:hypothetical protein